MSLNRREDFSNAFSPAKKCKTPHRSKKTLANDERTLALASKLKETVFEITREDSDNLLENSKCHR